MKTINIIHHNDMDGIAGAAVIVNSINNNKDVLHPYDITDGYKFNFVSYDYSSRADDTVYVTMDEALKHNEMVIIVDVSISKTNWPSFVPMSNLPYENLIWIDHHQSSINFVKSNVFKSYFDKMPLGKISKCRSGAYLAYQFMNNTRTTPYVIKLVDDYDRWIHEDPNSMKFSYALNTHPELSNPLCKLWSTLLGDYRGCGQVMFDILKSGAIISKYVETLNKKAYDTKAQSLIFRFYKSDYDGCDIDELSRLPVFDLGKETKSVSINVGIINADSNSSIFGEHFDEFDICIVWNKLNTGCYRYSLYSSNKHVNCNVLAEILGGGGHRSAAGTKNTVIELFNPTFNYKFDYAVNEFIIPAKIFDKLFSRQFISEIDNDGRSPRLRSRLNPPAIFVNKYHHHICDDHDFYIVYTDGYGSYQITRDNSKYYTKRR